ncbi:Aldo/keto reductase [Annulohypoxylon bovei var. microspora]|nr:Aldo/keto reductase [Annulohypoxylon bovei var. microspora]
MMGLSVAYGKAPSDEERFKVPDRAWELGAAFWDTAAGYGDCELFIGRWFKLLPERRQDIFATKFGLGWRTARSRFISAAQLRTARRLVTYVPLGRGFLTGRYKSLDDFEEKDGRRQLPRFSAENFSKNLDLVKIFEDLAARKGCTPARAVLAWIMVQGEDFILILGTKNIYYLEQNLGAANVQVSPGENKHIRDAIVAMGGVSGERTIDTTAVFADTPAL